MFYNINIKIGEQDMKKNRYKQIDFINEFSINS